MSKRKIIFMGTPDFAVPALAGLMDAGHDIVAVYTQPPRPAGRGYKETKSPVQIFAEQHGLMVRHPVSLKDEMAQKEFAGLSADLAVVAAYGLILPQVILDAPRYGCLNIHASLLPRWRGAAPIQRAMLAGDQITGITIMQMDAGLDTGDMILTQSCDIADDMNADDLHDRLADMGTELILEAVEKIDVLPRIKQPENGVTYAHKLTKQDGKIDWQEPAQQIDHQVRALHPWPGVWFELAGKVFKVGAVEIMDQSGMPGTVLDDQFTVACGEKSVRILNIQRPGKDMMNMQDFLRGFKIDIGMKLE